MKPSPSVLALLQLSGCPKEHRPPLFCQRSFLLGCPAPIRQGCLDVKDTQGTWNRPGRDVSWLPHLPVSGMVKPLSWGVTLGVLCVLLERFCVHASMFVALGQEGPIHKCRIYIKKKEKSALFLQRFLLSLACPPQNIKCIFEWQRFQRKKCLCLSE